jgi:plasmid stability protein
MGQITLELEDEVLEAYRARAKRHGRTLHDEIASVLGGRAVGDRHALVQRLRERHARTRAEHGLLPDSTDSIREMREGEP